MKAAFRWITVCTALVIGAGIAVPATCADAEFLKNEKTVSEYVEFVKETEAAEIEIQVVENAEAVEEIEEIEETEEIEVIEVIEEAHEAETVESPVETVSTVIEESEKEETVRAAKVETKTEAKTVNTTSTTSDYGRVYVSSVGIDAVEAPKAAQTTASAEAVVIDDGSYGKIIINEVGLNTTVYFTDDMSRLQEIVDAKDSACMFNWDDGNTMIADHNYQGFESIKSCSIGSTAELATKSGSSFYTCKEIIRDGWNNGDCLTYNDFTPISAKWSGCLVIYTCNAEGTITITIWG